jgi:drug/metabolite transporter (DMT)-like permease
MFPFAWKNFQAEKAIFKQNKMYFFLMALIGVAVYNTFIYTAGHYTTAINMALFGSTVHPIVAALLAAYVVNEKLHWKNITGIFLGIIGTLYLLTKGDIANIINFKIGTGDLWMIGAGICFGSYNVFVRKKPQGISNRSFLLCLFAVGALILLPAAVYEMNFVQPVVINWQLIFIVLYLGIGNSTIAYLLWNNAIQRIGAGKAALFGTLLPLLSSIEAVWLLNESFSTAQIISGLIIITGIVINTWPSKSKSIISV